MAAATNFPEFNAAVINQADIVNLIVTGELRSGNLGGLGGIIGGLAITVDSVDRLRQ
jgi:hypothetical protein